MDKKTYTKWMTKIAEGEKVTPKVHADLTAFAKAKKLRRPAADAVKARKAREKQAPVNCSVTSKQDAAVGKDGCQKPSRALGMCVAHYSRLHYRKDEQRAEKVRESSRKYAAKQRANKEAQKAEVAEIEKVLQDA